MGHCFLQGKSAGNQTDWAFLELFQSFNSGNEMSTLYNRQNTSPYISLTMHPHNKMHRLK